MMKTDSRHALAQAERWLDEGHQVAIATVVKTWGSAPRPPGSHMVICGTGDFVGSVSGGCVEAAVLDAARAVMQTTRPTVLDFGVSDQDAWAVGLACGGQIRVRVEPVV